MSQDLSEHSRSKKIAATKSKGHGSLCSFGCGAITNFKMCTNSPDFLYSFSSSAEGPELDRKISYFLDLYNKNFYPLVVFGISGILDATIARQVLVALVTGDLLPFFCAVDNAGDGGVFVQLILRDPLK